MGLKKLTENILYLPHVADTDRPMLVYIDGTRIKLAIDAGNSRQHVLDFYRSLDENQLPKPTLTVITHWHWDHTLGMPYVHGLSVANYKTNSFLAVEKEKFETASYVSSMKEDDPCFAKEYEGKRRIRAALSDIAFGGNLLLDLGGLTAEVFHTESPHSEDTTLIYIPEEKVLFLGDSTSEDYFNDGYMDFKKLESLIRVIEEKDCKYCVLSHAEPMEKSDLLTYLHSLFSPDESKG